MRIGLFASSTDLVAAHIQEKAEARGFEVLRFSFGSIGAGVPIAFDAEDWMIAGDVINDCGGFIVRNYPAIAAMLSEDPFEILTAETWWQRALQQMERSHVAQSCIMQMELSKKPVVNPLLASRPYDFKPLQLAAFKKAGIPIPETLVTNAPAAVHAFVDAYPEVIMKPTSGGAEARVVDEAMRANLEAVRQMPVIFQELIRGDDIRVTVVNGKVISAVEIPTEHVDYRKSEAYKAGEQVYVEHALPEKVEALCLEAARVCHHVLSGIDLKRSADGQYCVLEANSAPVYVDIENKLGHDITGAILDVFEG